MNAILLLAALLILAAALLAPGRSSHAGATVPPVLGTPVSCDDPCGGTVVYLPIVAMHDRNVFGPVEGQDGAT